MRAPSILSLVLLCSASGTVDAESVWVEAEDAAHKDLRRNSWYDGVKKDVLSGGEWLSHFDDGREGRADFRFDAAGGEYTLWIRANHVKSSLGYRIGSGGDWIAVDFARDVRDTMNIASDNKPDLRFIAWVKVGKVRLAKGANEMSLRFHSELSNHGAADCFVLTNDGFVPSGARKPSVELEAAPTDWFEFVPDDDEFSPESLIDMSRLIDAPAGKHGFLEADGDRLRFERAASPVKFWGIGANVGSRRSSDEMRRAARWFRKHGVNLVRQHTMLEAVGLARPGGDFDPERLDAYDRWFAALKEQGIYTCWSVVYPHHGAFVREGDVDPAIWRELARASGRSDSGSGGRAIVSGDFINLERALQDLALGYFRRLLEHRNPHTGLRYADDPALAIVEFQNESNVFFHTLNGLRAGESPRYAEMLRKGFFGFAEEKYGTKDATRAAWGAWDRDDDWERGELGIMGAYHWGAGGPQHEFAGRDRRAGDYIRFLARLQRDYYKRREKELREIGFRGVTVATAWKGVGASSLANLWCDTAAGMIDRHDYFGGGAGGHRIAEGPVSTDTHLDRPGRGLLDLGLFQVEGKPFAISEWSQMPPNRFKAEAAPLIAFYGIGLQGWDASCHFACGASRFEGGWPDLGKYVSQTPHYMGQFPALAFAIHRGHIREAEPIAARRVGNEDVFSGRDVLGQSIAEGEHDIKELEDGGATPPELLAIGKVTVEFSGERASELRPVDRLWDRDAKTLRSTTGELLWNYGERWVEVRSAKTQAIIGFAGGRKLALPIRLPDVEIALETPFVSLIFTPLDDLPLAESKSILITAMARDRQTGTEYAPGDAELITVGGPPLLMEPVIATIRLRGAAPKAVRALDIYGVPRDEVPPERGGAFRIDGRYRAYYYHVAR